MSYQIDKQQVDLWLEDLAISEAEYQHYWRLLDRDEQTKALSFFQEKHRQYYIASHGKLRTLLASYTDMTPKQLEFAYEKLGKPYLIQDGNPSSITFNLSHSEHKMLLAVSYQNPIGVDIETWRHNVDRSLIAESCFAETERSYWQHTTEAQQDAVFFQFWTRKESFIKAVGAGLSINVAEVITSTQGKTCLVSIPAAFGTADAWQVIDLEIEAGMSAALTIKNKTVNWQWRSKN